MKVTEAFGGEVVGNEVENWNSWLGVECRDEATGYRVDRIQKALEEFGEWKRYGGFLGRRVRVTLTIEDVPDE